MNFHISWGRNRGVFNISNIAAVLIFIGIHRLVADNVVPINDPAILKDTHTLEVMVVILQTVQAVFDLRHSVGQDSCKPSDRKIPIVGERQQSAKRTTVGNTQLFISEYLVADYREVTR